MRAFLAAVVFVLGAAPSFAQTRDLHLAWDLTPNHDTVMGWELEVDDQQLVNCGNLRVEPDSRRCTAQVPLYANRYRLRGVELPDRIGAWSEPVGEAPGAFFTRAHISLPFGVQIDAVVSGVGASAQTPPVTWPAGSRGYACVTSNTAPSAGTISSAGFTWAIIHQRAFAGTRRLFLLESPAVPANGPITVQVTGPTSVAWSIHRVTGSSERGAPLSAELGAQANSATLPSVGSGLVLSCAAHQIDGTAVQLQGQQTLSTTPSLTVGAATDDTPTASWPNVGGTIGFLGIAFR